MRTHNLLRSHIWRAVAVATALIALTACGTFTGIPSHGGGKRFAVEQELVAGTARAAIRSLDVTALRGKRVAVFMVGMGDEGSGNLIGGRYSVEALIRGGYINSPRSRFPVVTTTTTTGATTTVAENALNFPVEQEGSDVEASAALRYQGLGAFRNSDEIINPEDSQFLSAALQQYMVLSGVLLVPPEQAEIDAFILVDVFGTLRRRTDWYVANHEALIAKTALEMTAIERLTGAVVMRPQVASYEAEYRENYVLWAGPFKTTKELRPSDGLLVTYQELEEPTPLVTKISGLVRP